MKKTDIKEFNEFCFTLMRCWKAYKLPSELENWKKEQLRK